MQPAPDDSPSYPVVKCGDWVLSETWTYEYPGNQLLPKWKGPYQALLCAPMTVKPQGLPAGLICPGLNLFSTDILQKPEDPHSNYLCDIVDIDIHPFLQDPEDPEHENSSA